MENSESQTLKIVVAGLDNAGKTSMLTVLEKIYGFEEIVKFLKPTLGINYTKREYFDKKIMYWDFGGQKQFREKYLENDRYFADTQMLYYLIDIQDEMRYSESVDYLREILGMLNPESSTNELPIHICFSKSDFGIINDKAFDFPGKTAMIYKFFKKQYPELDLHFHYTSIYNISSMVSVHVRSLREAIPIFKEIEDQIEDFSKDRAILRIAITDHTGLPFINYTPEKSWLSHAQPKIDEQMNYQLQVIRATEQQQVHLNEVHEKSENINIDFFKFQADKQTGEVSSLDTIFEEFFGENFDSKELENKTPQVPDKSNYFLIGYSKEKNGSLSDDDYRSLIEKIQDILTPLKD